MYKETQAAFTLYYIKYSCVTRKINTFLLAFILIADSLYINSLYYYVIVVFGVWKGERSKVRGGAVVGRPGTRVNAYSSPRAKKLVFQESKAGMLMECKG
jgi:hypothetical protein